MLTPYSPPRFSREDQRIFDRLVRFDHWTRRADDSIDFLALRELMTPFFSDSGRPAVEPILCLKLELLMFHDALSDSQVFRRAETDLAYRSFLGLGQDDHLPDVSTLRGFRARLGVEGHQRIFHALLTQARANGLVKDRLRIKDATHVLADIAIPAGLQLIAQARNKLLVAAEPFDAEGVAGERVRIQTIRDSTDSRGNEERLVARVEHLRDIVAWTTELPPPDDADSNPNWQKLQKAIEVACKALAGHDDPKAPGKIRSVADPDARRGRHGDYFDGYVFDAMIDADSELLTAINVIPAGSSESADALVLLEQERSAHGNTIEQLSIDGAGYDGAVIREIEEQGVRVFVPPKEQTNGKLFSSEEFELSDDGSHATCPAGEQSQYKQRDENRHTTAYRFNTQKCHACLLKAKCIDLKQKYGRTVRKNDYQAEYEMVRRRAQTEEYAAVKKEHPKIERRLGVVVNQHDGRRARYRGQTRVHVQKIAEAITHNLCRIIRLLDAKRGFVT